MARKLKARRKYERRFGLIPVEPGEKPARRTRKTDYGQRLEEKQKLKFVYGLRERQLTRYIHLAQSSQEEPAVRLFQLLESRLDNVVYRLGWAKTRLQARQLVNHGHMLVDGRKMDIPSYNVQPGQQVTVKERIADREHFKELVNSQVTPLAPGWLQRADKDNIGTVLAWPSKDEMRQDINFRTVLELYR